MSLFCLRMKRTDNNHIIVVQLAIYLLPLPKAIRTCYSVLPSLILLFVRTPLVCDISDLDFVILSIATMTQILISVSHLTS